MITFFKRLFAIIARFVRNLFKLFANQIPGVCIECDPHEICCDTKNVRYSRARITHKEAVRLMAQYGMSAVHDPKKGLWTIKYFDQSVTSDSFREAVQDIKVG